MEWIIEISKKTILVSAYTNGQSNYRYSVDIKDGWQATVDKMDELLLVKLFKGDKVIHIGMFPLHLAAVVWRDIGDIYKSYEQ